MTPHPAVFGSGFDLGSALRPHRAVQAHRPTPRMQRAVLTRRYGLKAVGGKLLTHKIPRPLQASEVRSRTSPTRCLDPCFIRGRGDRESEPPINTDRTWIGTEHRGVPRPRVTGGKSPASMIRSPVMWWPFSGNTASTDRPGTFRNRRPWPPHRVRRKDCLHAFYAPVPPKPPVPPRPFFLPLLSGCIRFAKTEMHLSARSGIFSTQVPRPEAQKISEVPSKFSGAEAVFRGRFILGQSFSVRRRSPPPLRRDHGSPSARPDRTGTGGPPGPIR